VEVKRMGNAVAFYSATMPWSTFNTVKGMRAEDHAVIEEWVDWFRSKGRKAQFELLPSKVDAQIFAKLAELGLHQSGFHTSMYAMPELEQSSSEAHLSIRELHEDEFELYATIHCRGTGLPDHGIPYVAENNKVLYHRPGWKFYMAYCEGQPAAAGVLFIREDVASLTFAATLPEFRNQGLHQALIRHRMNEAVRNGCRLVVGQCAFLSQSHRNMEACGMRIGYVRSTWT